MSFNAKLQSSLLNGLLVLAFCSSAELVAQNRNFDDYHGRVEECINALDTLAAIDESEDSSSYDARVAQTIEQVLATLPATEKISWDSGYLDVDNKWLHDDLVRYGKAAEPARREGISSVAQRLKAVDERLAEIEEPSVQNEASKATTAAKIKEILERPEYTTQERQESALGKLFREFFKWLQQLIPKQQALTPGRANLFTQIAQYFVILLALAVIAYVLRMFAPAFFRRRKTAKKQKTGPRVVLGEKLEPDQTALDLLNEAEALARQGDIRAAIRKAYIALLVELGDRKILSLAQHKTNRDYLRAVSEEKLLYESMKGLTDSFERHWYGLTRATEADWSSFRSAYNRALMR